MRADEHQCVVFVYHCLCINCLYEHQCERNHLAFFPIACSNHYHYKRTSMRKILICAPPVRTISNSNVICLHVAYGNSHKNATSRTYAMCMAKMGLVLTAFPSITRSHACLIGCLSFNHIQKNRCTQQASHTPKIPTPFVRWLAWCQKCG